MPHRATATAPRYPARATTATHFANWTALRVIATRTGHTTLTAVTIFSWGGGLAGGASTLTDVCCGGRFTPCFLRHRRRKKATAEEMSVTPPSTNPIVIGSATLLALY